MNTNLPSKISGRIWEHMWQYLFLSKDIDCPLEHRAYCRLYHICFGGREEYDEWIELNQGRQKLEKELKKLKGKEEEDRKIEMGEKKQNEEAKNNGTKARGEERPQSEVAEKARAKTKKWLEDELASVREAIRVRREVAVVRGAVEINREIEGENIYGDEIEPGLEKIILPPSAIATSITSRLP